MGSHSESPSCEEIRSTLKGLLKVTHQSRDDPPLPTEVEHGNVEYKWKLVDCNDEKTDCLASQMKFRLGEGGGEAHYKVGVEDCGRRTGLPLGELAKTIRTLYIVSSKLGVNMAVRDCGEGVGGKDISSSYGGHGDDGVGPHCIADVYVEVDPLCMLYDFKAIDIRIAIIGVEKSGKSTLAGVLTSDQDERDNGMGSSRTLVFNHPHEWLTGRTSSVSPQVMVFDTAGNALSMTKFRENMARGLMKNFPTLKPVSLIDLPGYGEGGGEYFRTSVGGILTYNPDYLMLVIASDQPVEIVRPLLQIAVMLRYPLLVVATKSDVGRKETTSEIAELLKDYDLLPKVVNTRSEMSDVRDERGEGWVPSSSIGTGIRSDKATIDTGTRVSVGGVNSASALMGESPAGRSVASVMSPAGCVSIKSGSPTVNIAHGLSEASGSPTLNLSNAVSEVSGGVSVDGKVRGSASSAQRAGRRRDDLRDVGHVSDGGGQGQGSANGQESEAERQVRFASVAAGLTAGLTPIIATSAVEGEGIELLRDLIGGLRHRVEWDLVRNKAARFRVSRFYSNVSRAGPVAVGLLCSGCVEGGDVLYCGPLSSPQLVSLRAKVIELVETDSQVTEVKGDRPLSVSEAGDDHANIKKDCSGPIPPSTHSSPRLPLLPPPSTSCTLVSPPHSAPTSCRSTPQPVEASELSDSPQKYYWVPVVIKTIEVHRVRVDSTVAGQESSFVFAIAPRAPVIEASEGKNEMMGEVSKMTKRNEVGEVREVSEVIEGRPASAGNQNRRVVLAPVIPDSLTDGLPLSPLPDGTSGVILTYVSQRWIDAARMNPRKKRSGGPPRCVTVFHARVTMVNEMSEVKTFAQVFVHVHTIRKEGKRV
eukprot:GHVN01003801.1.p1 GENE.GHVN01003801.1~~GHVN01003801.1.p1  ORF type:complete len:871 (-),score=211.05 GHVN01003801.1:402-3014(-)